WNKVGPGLHFLSTCMVALGTLMSTFWILASNSWMHTPQGFEIKERTFFANPVLTNAVDQAKNAGKAVHIMGLLSAGGVHSH
ncbi:cytochrome ubiquinol oxidase subunit I, partial [Salmonella enterica subsp. enterica serovar Montevideo]|nr:cytochrome ubiquinol oxidase subunit I [Salmonella enterica subsp. enterica serovar Montevideo]